MFQFYFLQLNNKDDNQSSNDQEIMYWYPIYMVSYVKYEVGRDKRWYEKNDLHHKVEFSNCQSYSKFYNIDKIRLISLSVYNNIKYLLFKKGENFWNNFIYKILYFIW